ncbi:MAG: hypothetical protein AAB787_01420 [Patescibacteria group bacterium]
MDVLKLFYKEIAGAEPDFKEVIEIAREGSTTALGLIKRNGNFIKSAPSDDLSISEMAQIMGAAIRFSRFGRAGVPEATEIE